MADARKSRTVVPFPQLTREEASHCLCGLIAAGGKGLPSRVTRRQTKRFTLWLLGIAGIERLLTDPLFPIAVFNVFLQADGSLSSTQKQLKSLFTGALLEEIDTDVRRTITQYKKDADEMSTKEFGTKIRRELRELKRRLASDRRRLLRRKKR